MSAERSKAAQARREPVFRSLGPLVWHWHSRNFWWFRVGSLMLSRVA